MKSKLASPSVTLLSALLLLYPGLLPKAQSAVIPSRNDLTSQLGLAAVTEDFEGYVFPVGDARRVGTMLDASSVIEGQGPGLVREGVRFIQSDVNGEGLQWDRQFQYGLQSAALVTDGQLIIDFTTPVTHVGFDMFWFNVGNPPSSPATVQVFGTDDASILHSINMFEPYAPDSFFFGFADNGGIGRVVLFRDEGEFGFGGSPIIDNLTFGFAPVPEPGILTLALLGVGGCLILRWRRKL